MKNVLMSIILGLTTISVSAAVKHQHANLTNYAKTIHHKSAGKPTNNTLWFHGHQNYVTYYSRARISRADVRFTAFLMRTYHTYCSLKKKKYGCLGSRLKITTKINGTSLSNKILSVNINGASFVSNYYAEIIKKSMEQFERIGGKMSLSNNDRSILFPNPKLVASTDFHVLFPETQKVHANNKWAGHGFVNAVFERSRRQMHNLFRFNADNINIIKSNRDYFSKSQHSTLVRYSRLRKNSRVTTVITGPSTSDSLGRAWQRNTSSPYFVMRSWFNTKANSYSERALAHNSQVFIHELGHNMGLGHCSKGQKSACTDNLWANKTNALKVTKYLQSIGAMKAKYAI